MAMRLILLILITATPAPALELRKRLVEATLGNGLKVLLVERPQAPVVSLVIRFKAGSVDEPLGETGIAHLLEHMLFKGTTTIGTRDYAREKVLLEEIDRVAREVDTLEAAAKPPEEDRIRQLREERARLQQQHEELVVKDELEETYDRAGAVDFNAYTDTDLTTYVVSLPANKIELWMRIEADRMSNPVCREFYQERSVVLEERRTRTEDDPWGCLYEQFKGLAFLAHPYGHPVIGWPSDVQRCTVAMAERFHRTFYAPNNTVIAIVGAIDPFSVLTKMQDYFGVVPPQPLPPPLVTREPKPRGERRVTVRFAAEPQILIGFHKPTCPHPDDTVFDVIQALLSDGRTSRFYRSLVEGQEMAIEAWASNGWPGNRFDNLFVIGASPRYPHPVAELEKAIDRELERLKTEPVSPEELTRISNQVEASFIWGLGSNEGLALQLSHAQIVLGNWQVLVDYPGKIRQVTPADIRRVCRTYLTAENRCTAVLERAAEPKEGGGDAATPP